MNNSSSIKNSIKESVVQEWTLHEWGQRVALLPEVAAAGLLDIEALTHGTVNKSFKVTTNKGTWVVRFNNDELPGIHRPTEARILEAIQPLDLAPRLIANHVNQGYLITVFCEGTHWTQSDLSNPQQLRRLAEVLQPLHQIPFSCKRTELVFRLVEYIHYFTKMDDGLKSAINKTVSELSHMGFWQKQKQLLHFDLNPMNIICNGDELKIIDWEYAGVGHPIIEWSVIQNYAGVDIQAQIPEFFGIHYPEKVQKLIDLMMEMWQF